MSSPNGDAYTFGPMWGLICMAVLAVLLLMFDPGGLIAQPPMLLAILVLLSAAVVWFFAAAIFALRGRWRRFLSINLGGIAALAVTFLGLKFSDQIHFQIMLPVYLIEIAHAQDASRMEWGWAGGAGYDKSLVYDSLAAGVSSPADESEEKTNGCSVTTRRMGGQFYLRIVTC